MTRAAERPTRSITASARIAKIPRALSTHIARVYRPELTETK